ncbi:hypothetical protein RRG08_004924 [Elysia crispata]|uniref:Uncharacterized protein n=1 Tax=Elysia crispata TaxID=231223 RepID=A0AAE0ZHY3_9GAST|nr:hypothetical protein RRG08_004924 [Elysia crispata]
MSMTHRSRRPLITMVTDAELFVSEEDDARSLTFHGVVMRADQETGQLLVDSSLSEKVRAGRPGLYEFPTGPMFLVAAVCSLNPREAAQLDALSHRQFWASHGGEGLVTTLRKPGVFYAPLYGSTRVKSEKL